MTRKQDVEAALGRKITEAEAVKYCFYWTKVFMNPFDLAARIARGA